MNGGVHSLSFSLGGGGTDVDPEPGRAERRRGGGRGAGKEEARVRLHLRAAACFWTGRADFGNQKLRPRFFKTTAEVGNPKALCIYAGIPPDFGWAVVVFEFSNKK